MKNNILFSLLLTFSLVCHGQIGNSDGGQVVGGTSLGYIGGDHLPDAFLKSGKRTLKYEHIQGTPYIDNKQEEQNAETIGKLYTSKGKYVNTFFMRYNGYTDNMELSLIDNGIDYFFLKKKPNSWYVVLGENQYKCYEYYDNNQNKLGFFVVLSENSKEEYSLFRKEKVLFKPRVNEKNGFLSATPDRFVKGKNSYFLKYGDKMMKVPKNKKEFFKLFHTKQDLLKSYIKKNRYSTSNQKDLNAIVTYYNSII